MITICDSFNNCKLDKENNRDIYTIYAWERIIIAPNEIKIISLPYKRLKLDNKFYNFQIDKKLSLQNLECRYNNINDVSSLYNLEFVIKNSSIDLNNDVLTRVVGSRFKIDIFSGSIFGRIFC